ncbi:hypothetical protein [Candidatus Nanohalobium constans]|uniref:hypothetical protein n=1 Tax=Candidatus Nanohalobium constans TaxID=2565781 RepID=UPI002116BACB|nr:hypothetical protein [Candidatus Nanohalobium constans]
MTRKDVSTEALPKNIAIKPASASINSQPGLVKTPPKLTKEVNNTHKAIHTTVTEKELKNSVIPVKIVKDSKIPVKAEKLMNFFDELK